MTKAEVGDLIVWSAMNRWSPMEFGLVYQIKAHGTPWVINMASGRKQQGGSQYLVLAREGEGEWLDSSIHQALTWWMDQQE